jgi:hypothetical protein
MKMKVVQGKPNGSYIDFPDGEFLIGRGPECHIRPKSRSISRQHCLVTVNGPNVRVRDLGSTSGTVVNGRRIVEECALKVGDFLQVGSLVLEMIQGTAERDERPSFPPALGEMPGDPGLPVRPPGAHPAYPVDTPVPGSLRALTRSTGSRIAQPDPEPSGPNAARR